MKNLLVPGLVLLVVCTNAFSQRTDLSVPRVQVDGETVNAESTFKNLLPDVNAYRDFSERLKAAVESRDRVALQALYLTNGVSPEELSEELNRWRPMLEGDAGSRVSIQDRGTIFRDFTLSNKMWKHLAGRLTTHKATHLVELMTTKSYWMLPLVEVEGRLLIVPSDKSKDMGFRLEDIQPEPATSESQPAAAVSTNAISGAAESGR